jgi:hypothetical protein
MFFKLSSQVEDFLVRLAFIDVTIPHGGMNCLGPVLRVLLNHVLLPDIEPREKSGKVIAFFREADEGPGVVVIVFPRTVLVKVACYVIRNTLRVKNSLSKQTSSRTLSASPYEAT